MDAYSIFPLDPSKIAWTSKIKPKWDVTKYTSASQGRRTLTHQAYPTWQFDISFPALTTQEVDALLAFHMFCKGSWNPFFYKDYERHNANVTLKDGETYYYKANGLPLIIPLSVGGYTFGEPCYMADFVRVYRNGVEDTENFTVTADDSGQLRVYLTDVETDEGTLQTTVITATYEYYYRVAFQDSITINERFRNNYSVSLSLETVKQTVTNTGDNDIWQGGNIYNVTITQSANQLISVKKIKNGTTIATYTSSFQIIGSYMLEISVEASSGYAPGRLYVDGVRVASGTRLTVDHDINIVATAAEPGNIVYMNGTRTRFTSGMDYYYRFYSDSSCTTTVKKGDLIGKLVVRDVSSDATWQDAPGILGSNNQLNQRCTQITAADVSDVNVSRITSFNYALGECPDLLKIEGLNGWNPVSAVSFAAMFRHSSLLSEVGDISHWNTPELTSIAAMFYQTSVEYVDMQYWNTPNLALADGVFESVATLRVVDISGLNTTNVTSATRMFYNNTSLQYVIMNSDDIKFSGDVVMPEGNSTVKYLVPANMVATYQAHANWSARASRIDSIDNYTITRNNGQITVTER